jgi:hypothetical protein
MRVTHSVGLQPTSHSPTSKLHAAFRVVAEIAVRSHLIVASVQIQSDDSGAPSEAEAGCGVEIIGLILGTRSSPMTIKLRLRLQIGLAAGADLVLQPNLCRDYPGPGGECLRLS